MYEPGEIAKTIYEIGKRLEKGSKETFSLAKKMAETERDYRKALAIEMVKLKTEGNSITLIPDLARGNTSELKFERDLAEARYKSARDMLSSLQAEMNGLQSIFKRFEEI